MRSWRPASFAAFAVVFAGGIGGGSARVALLRLFPDPVDSVGWTLVGINVGGAFALSLLVSVVTGSTRVPAWVRPAFGTGFLGAFTTFSALAVVFDARLGLVPASDGSVASPWHAVAIMAVHVGLGLLAAFAGFAVGGAIRLRRDGVR